MDKRMEPTIRVNPKTNPPGEPPGAAQPSVPAKGKPAGAENEEQDRLRSNMSVLFILGYFGFR